MTPEERAREICEALEAEMRRLGVITTAHYPMGTERIAAAIRAAVEEERHLVLAHARPTMEHEAIRAAVAAEREACARVADREGSRRRGAGGAGVAARIRAREG